MSFPQTPLITLTTDFGTRDSYVPQMKGAILGVNPHARLIDVTHEVSPQDVLRGSYLLADIAGTFPSGTVHLAVIDPGVGGDRSILAAEVNHQYFVVPDNGLLTETLRRWSARQIVRLQNPEFWRDDISSTFHGRDIMGPVAGHLSRGVNLCELGAPLQAMPRVLSTPEPTCDEDRVGGEVLWSDRFGNLVTNITRHELATADDEEIRVEIAGRSVSGVCNCYADVEESGLLALFGSTGLLEVSANCGSAAEILSCGVGEPVNVLTGLAAPHRTP